MASPNGVQQEFSSSCHSQNEENKAIINKQLLDLTHGEGHCSLAINPQLLGLTSWRGWGCRSILDQVINGDIDEN